MATNNYFTFTVYGRARVFFFDSRNFEDVMNAYDQARDARRDALRQGLPARRVAIWKRVPHEGIWNAVVVGEVYSGDAQ